MIKQDGSTGPHPKIEKLKSYQLIIRARTMSSPEARQQALAELTKRGLWI